MSWILTLLPIAMRALGLARYTAEAIKLLPYISKYGPLVFGWIENSQATWAKFKKDHPTFAGLIERIAAKVLPKIPIDQAAEITMVGIFLPGRMRPDYEKIWMDRASATGAGN